MKTLPDALQRLGLAFALILMAGAMLLWSDRHSRYRDAPQPSAASTAIPVALLVHSSNPVLDATQEGVIDGLAARGYRDGKELKITVYNPEGDLATGNLMAQKIAGGADRLTISISTVMLQALANANRAGRIPHVFGAVTSPVGAGVGIRTLDSLDKPPHLTGIGTPQPVDEIFRLAKRLHPQLKTVGVVWNPAEVNSEICTQRARVIAGELGLTLLEAPIEQTKDVREAAESLVSRGAEAFWTGGDASVGNAVDSLIGVAQSARIPVFSNMAGHIEQGSLFDLGANYHEVGLEIGRLASEILGGADPARLPVRDYVPRRLLLNEKALGGLRDSWQFDETAKAEAAEIRLADGSLQTSAGTTASNTPAHGTALPLTAPKPGRIYKVGVAYFAPEPGIDAVLDGLRAELKTLGYEESRNLQFRMLHAQAEIAQIPTIGQVLDNSDADVILTLTTPVLQGAGITAKRKPVVFTYVSDPLAAGAGRNFTEHLANITGIGSMPPVEDMLAITREVLPAARTFGTLYNPSEANSVKVATALRELVAKAGLKLEEAPINNTAEVVQAMQALVSRRVDAILSVGDNTFYQAFDVIAKVAKDARLPLIIDQSDFLDHEALMVIGADYRESGRAAADPLARLLNGTDPASIPFRNVAKRTVLLNEKSAKRLGLQFPEAVRGMVSGAPDPPAAGHAPLDHPWKIWRLLYVESPPADETLAGMAEGFKAAGLVAGRDYVLQEASAQGDMSTLPALANAARSDGAELLIVLSTPTLQTVVQKVKNIPVVFTFVADPILAGAGQDNEHHLPNVTGVYTEGPHAEMGELLARDFPQYRTVGTLFSPAEDNSVHNKGKFAIEMTKRGISLITLPVSSHGELADAALALATKPIDAIVQLTDNQSAVGFTAIARAAARAKKPLLCFTEAGVRQGAAVGVTLSYRQAGYDAALKAAKIMRGTPPSAIPFSRPSHVQVIVSEDNARNLGMTLPASLVKRADKRLVPAH